MTRFSQPKRIGGVVALVAITCTTILAQSQTRPSKMLGAIRSIGTA